MHKLSFFEQEEQQKTVPEWSLKENPAAIVRDLIFVDFPSCVVFFTHVAFLAEKHVHHPECTQCYNKLSILLTTHDVGGLSEKDFALAREIDILFSRQGS
jgi:4a-hydroxytetrahydrobiopterin dehydratase